MVLTCKKNRNFFTRCLSCVKKKINVLLIEELLVDWQLAELQNELHSVKEKRDVTQRDYSELTEKKQVQIRMRLTDAIFGRLVVDIRELFAAMPSGQKADLDGEFLTAIAEQPNEILKCAMYLFFGYLDGATQYVSFASRSLANVGRNSPNHAEAEVPLPTCHGVAKRMKTTAASPTAA